MTAPDRKYVPWRRYFGYQSAVLAVVGLALADWLLFGLGICALILVAVDVAQDHYDDKATS